MALVHLNAKEATTVAMRTLSGLKGNEKKDFPNYFKELGQFSNLLFVDISLDRYSSRGSMTIIQ